MKKILPFLLVLIALASCTPKNQYTIRVSAVGGPDSLMVHNNWYTSSDTLKLVDDKCTFTGIVDTFPKLVSVGFALTGQRTARIILEPGNITVEEATLISECWTLTNCPLRIKVLMWCYYMKRYIIWPVPSYSSANAIAF